MILNFIFVLQYLPVFLYFLITTFLVILLLGVSFLLSTRRADPEKVSAYGCEFDPFDNFRSRFDIKFYLVTILFIIDDMVFILKKLIIPLCLIFPIIGSNCIYTFLIWYIKKDFSYYNIGLTSWLKKEIWEFGDAIFIWPSDETLLQLYFSLALVACVSCFLLYQITKKYYIGISFIVTSINYCIMAYLSSAKVEVKKELILFGTNLGDVAFNYDTSIFLVFGTVALFLLHILTPARSDSLQSIGLLSLFASREARPISKKEKKEVVFHFSYLLSQVIHLLLLIKVTALEGAGDWLFWVQVATFPTSLLLSLIIMGAAFFIIDKIKQWRNEWGQIKFELRFSVVALFSLLFSFLFSPRGKEIDAFILEGYGIDIIIWVWSPLLGVALLLCVYFELTNRGKKKWEVQSLLTKGLIHVIFWIALSFRLGLFFIVLLDGSLLVSQLRLLFFLVDLVFLKPVAVEAVISIISSITSVISYIISMIFPPDLQLPGAGGSETPATGVGVEEPRVPLPGAGASKAPAIGVMVASPRERQLVFGRLPTGEGAGPSTEVTGQELGLGMDTAADPITRQPRSPTAGGSETAAISPSPTHIPFLLQVKARLLQGVEAIMDGIIVEQAQVEPPQIAPTALRLEAALPAPARGAEAPATGVENPAVGQAQAVQIAPTALRLEAALPAPARGAEAPATGVENPAVGQAQAVQVAATALEQEAAIPAPARGAEAPATGVEEGAAGAVPVENPDTARARSLGFYIIVPEYFLKMVDDTPGFESYLMRRLACNEKHMIPYMYLNGILEPKNRNFFSTLESTNQEYLWCYREIVNGFLSIHDNAYYHTDTGTFMERYMEMTDNEVYNSSSQLYQLRHWSIEHHRDITYKVEQFGICWVGLLEAYIDNIAEHLIWRINLNPRIGALVNFHQRDHVNSMIGNAIKRQAQFHGDLSTRFNIKLPEKRNQTILEVFKDYIKNEFISSQRKIQGWNTFRRETAQIIPRSRHQAVYNQQFDQYTWLINREIKYLGERNLERALVLDSEDQRRTIELRTIEKVLRSYEGVN